MSILYIMNTFFKMSSFFIGAIKCFLVTNSCASMNKQYSDIFQKMAFGTIIWAKTECEIVNMFINKVIY